MIFSAIVWPVIAALVIFILWVLWIIATSLKGVDESLKEIAHKTHGSS
jgi:hypothetical protein